MFFIYRSLISKGMSLAANVIFIIHILVVLFFVITPFLPVETYGPLLVLHAISTVFIWFHWFLEDDTCALTVMEAKFRGMSWEEAKSGKSFFHNIVSPIYKIEDDDVREISWGISFILWIITMVKLTNRPDVMKELYANFKRVFKSEQVVTA